jgi:hypothetical protein
VEKGHPPSHLQGLKVEHAEHIDQLEARSRVDAHIDLQAQFYGSVITANGNRASIVKSLLEGTNIPFTARVMVFSPPPPHKL